MFYRLCNIANAFTLMRVALTPFIVGAIVHRNWQAALILFVVAAASDMFDGFFARLLHQESDFGAMLDPVADKIMMISVFGALVVTLAFPLWFVVLFAVRELILLGGGLWQAVYFPSVRVTPLWLGKLTMGAQMVTGVLVLSNALGLSFFSEGPFIVATAVLGVLSGLQYLARAFFMATKRV